MSFLDDDDVEVASEEGDDADFDENLFRATAHTETSSRLLDSLGAAHRTISSFTLDEFLTEAYTASVNMRNILGDTDGYAAENAELIRTNLRVVAVGIKSRPAEYVIAALRADNASYDQQIAKLTEIIDTLNTYKNTIAGS